MKKIELKLTKSMYDIVDNIAKDFEKDIDSVIAGMIQYANDKAFNDDEDDGIVLLEGFISASSRFLKREMGEEMYEGD